jgi:hypothetical protein
MSPLIRLLVAVGLVVVIWQIPYGQQILYPLSLLATLAHELGHGLCALLMGADFESLAIYADGSGMAYWRGNPGPLGYALIAAGGLIGPTVAGVTLLCFSHRPNHVRWILAILAVLAGVVMVLWVRNPFGLIFMVSLAIGLGLSSRFLDDGSAAIMLNLVAVTLCLSLFKDVEYMFSAVAVVDGVAHPSDSATIAAALWLPYWFWGGLLAALSLGLLVLGLWVTGRQSGSVARDANAPNSA